MGIRPAALFPRENRADQSGNDKMILYFPPSKIVPSFCVSALWANFLIESILPGKNGNAWDLQVLLLSGAFRHVTAMKLRLRSFSGKCPDFRFSV